MADRIEVKQVTVPAGTTIGAPQTTALAWRDGVVRRLEVLIPPGPSGLSGFRILHSGQVIIPFAADTWIIADDEVLNWDLDNFPTGAKWSLRAYNTDIYEHTYYMRWHIDEIRSALTPYPAPILEV